MELPLEVIWHDGAWSVTSAFVGVLVGLELVGLELVGLELVGLELVGLELVGLLVGWSREEC